MTYSEIDTYENEPDLPKIHLFAKELMNWLSLAAICMFVIYGILYVVYEVALNLTDVRWVFTAFLACCVIDVVSYWICRFAVSDASGPESCFIWLVLVIQSLTGLFYFISPVVVLCTYRFAPEASMMQGEKLLIENEEKLKHTLEDYVDPDPCLEEKEGENKKEPLWQCSYVRSIRTAACCIWMSMVPKILVCYLLVRILKSLSKAKNNIRHDGIRAAA